VGITDVVREARREEVALDRLEAVLAGKCGDIVKMLIGLEVFSASIKIKSFIEK